MKRFAKYAQDSLRAGAFLQASQGFAAVEFAVAAPLLALMLLGFVELDRYAWATRQLDSAATSVAQMLTQSTQPINNGDIRFAQDSVMVLFPRVLQDSALVGHKWSDDISVGISSVAFNALNPACIGPACPYQAKVTWSGGSQRRACNAPLAPVPDADAPSPATLPADAFGPNAIVVVDLVYTYRPLFAKDIFGAITLKRSAYLQPRYVSEVKYAVAGGDSLVTTCS